MERRTQRRVVRKSRKIRKNVFLLLTLALILCLGTFAMGAQKGRETKTYYESVEIQRGDTIWDIAKEYKAEGQKTEQMVDAICEVNGLKTANILAHSVNKLNHTAHTLPRGRPPCVNRNIAFTRCRRKKFSRKPDFLFL